MPNERRRKRPKRQRPSNVPGPAPDTRGDLRPNKPCPRCGAENIATADRCIACGAAFEGAARPSEGVGATWEKKGQKPSAAEVPATGVRIRWQNDFFRIMGILAIGVSTFYVAGGPIALAVVVSLALVIRGFAAPEVKKARAGSARTPVLAQVLDLVVCAAGWLACIPFLPVVLLLSLLFSSCLC